MPVAIGALWFMTSTNKAPKIHEAPPVIICQTDTLIQKVVKIDTVYFPVIKTKKQAIRLPASPTPEVPPVAYTPSSFDNDVPPLTEITRLDEIKTNNTGYSLKEHPDLEVFLTDEKQ